MMEQWADIPGFNGEYRVSSLGRVSSVKYGKFRMLKPVVSTGGYQLVCLRTNGKQRNYRVHQLVAMAFIRQQSPGEYVCHNDGNRLNNIVENLRIDTPIANADDRNGHGTLAVGERHGRAKLTSESVLEIRRLKFIGMPRSEIAQTIGTTESAVKDVLSGRTWSHI